MSNCLVLWMKEVTHSEIRSLTWKNIEPIFEYESKAPHGWDHCRSRHNSYIYIYESLREQICRNYILLSLLSQNSHSSILSYILALMHSLSLSFSLLSFYHFLSSYVHLANALKSPLLFLQWHWVPTIHAIIEVASRSGIPSVSRTHSTILRSD